MKWQIAAHFYHVLKEFRPASMPRGIHGRAALCAWEVPYRGRNSSGQKERQQGLIKECEAITYLGFLERELLSCRAKNVIPERRTNAVTGMIIVEVMAEMILFQPPPDAAFHGEMVYRVMDRIVANVTEPKSR